ncbi:molybdopterin molybdotransferase MoeA [Kocuria palustris]|uniref:molybdopterin molybdotransferase MoeA n=1 Tax=Kocuria palustris TaxID=71999 RepID=UPI0011A6F95D|nr:molybdopterin molybdotransferase MoeA [Kocuria palustris]
MPEQQKTPAALRRPDWATARQAAYDVAAPLPPHWLPLEETVGETLAEDLRAERPVPHYTSSAMDGWAVHGPGPWRINRGRLEEVDQRLAWARTEEPRLEPATSIAPGEAAPIVTGGLVPEGATAVLRSEWGIEDGEQLGLSPQAPEDAPREGQHLRRAGREAETGELLIRARTRLTPGHVAFAATTGQDMLPLLRRPRVTLLLTGDEVDEAGLPEPGRVRDAFGPQLPQFIHQLGGQVDAAHRVGDDREQMLERLSGSATGAEGLLDSRAHLIITTGGTGRSTADHLRPSLESSGAQLIIDELGLRPGHPALLARMPDDGPYVLGLPGNPLAAMTTLMLLGSALLAGLGGNVIPPLTEVALTRSLPASTTDRLAPGLAFVAGAAVSGATITDLSEGAAARGTELPSAVALSRAGSDELRGFSQANVLLVIPADGVRPGEPVQALPLPWL